MSKLSGNKQVVTLNIISLLFLAIFSLRLIVALFGNVYDWDVDHEMYFGARLLNGEMLYTREYHDKLPLVQYLFLVPAALGSVHAWALLSFVICICGALALRKSLTIMVKQGMMLGDSLVQSIATCGASFYLLLVSSSPGSLTTINPGSASFSIISLYFLLCATNLQNSDSRYSFLMLSAACGAIAISIRPYMAPSIVLLGIWISSRRLALDSQSSLSARIEDRSKRRALVAAKPILLFTLLWILLLFLAGVVLNGMPYLLGGSIDSLIDGIRHNAQHLNPESPKSILFRQTGEASEQGAAIWIASSFAVLSSVLVLVKRFSEMVNDSIQKRPLSRVAYVDIILLGIVSLILLELTLLSRHYWSHYQQLFSPYLAISFALGLAIVFDQQLAHVRLRTKPRAFVILTAIAALLLSRSELYSAVDSVRQMYTSHAETSVLSDINRVLVRRASDGLPASFLDASHMYSHWQLNESRHGFPHAASFSHIGRGWWEGLDRTSKKLSGFPYSRKDLCENLNSRGPALVFLREDSTAYECFASSSSAYRRLGSPMLTTPNLIAYERNSYNLTYGCSPCELPWAKAAMAIF